MSSDLIRLFGSSSDAIFVVDPETREVLYQNRHADALVGETWTVLPDGTDESLRELLAHQRESCSIKVQHPKRGEIGVQLRFGGWPSSDSYVYIRGSECQRSDSDGSTTEYQDPNYKELQALNYRDLLQRVGDRVEIAEEVIQNIRESLPNHIAECRTAFERGNLTELRQVAHTVKGSAGTAGAEIVAERAGQINKLLRRNITDPTIIEEALHALEDATTRFLATTTQKGHHRGD